MPGLTPSIGDKLDAIYCALYEGTGLGSLELTVNTLNIAAPNVPANASDTGTAGDVAWDANFIYICVATNTWKRVAIATW